jgi:hypothetical protein
MKNLELSQMENVYGGYSGKKVLYAGNVACAGVGLLSTAGAVFTFGSSLALGVAFAGAFCTGWGIGQLF